MIAVDTNILVYAHRRELPQHGRARGRLTELAEGSARWAIPVFCLGEFLRVTTHPRLLAPPFAIDEACEALKRVLESPSVVVLMPGERFWPLLAGAVAEAEAAGNLVFDAQVAALCREAGVSALLTEDRDFDRFPGFKTARL
ncbi:MAG: TA system VapC family ribonuclease toxin [Candidatus Rokuibacteriota bacterium]